MPLRSLFRLLTLLLGIFYLDTVCQTDAEDARAYYARGIQEYVAAPDAVAVVGSVAQPAARVRARRTASCWPRRYGQQQLATKAVPQWPQPPVPGRRWLRFGVVQV